MPHLNTFNIIEFIAAALAIAGVILSKNRSVWCWIVNIISSLLYGYVFFFAGLYADAILQGVFVCLSMYGWIEWKVDLAQHNFIAISTLTKRELYSAVAGTALLSIVIRSVLLYGTPSDVPTSDALTTAMSLVGIWLQTRRAIENWWWWIIADVIYMGLYIYKDLYITAALYGIFVFLAWQGFTAWRTALQTEPSSPQSS